ncbi:hypothetical protein [Haloferula sp. A504]|uniref:hypothetical protein n=1 Tax=Haloferula sp. A504 TaxID=3373601 RepID=UPI0031C45E2D|nr:hypothetical protein [Verrucomicrobiaceae bacterium E54]
MRRIPLIVVILSIPLVIGITWWLGTRHHDFLREPTATEIETAKLRATSELIRPSDLFVLEGADSEEPPEPAPPPPPGPEPVKPKPPLIDISDPTSEAPIDAWAERLDLPAGSFIELASRLESDAHLAWARVTWERVIDLADSSPEDLEVAVRAIARIRASMPPPAEVPEGAPAVGLVVDTPEDRVELTRRAAAEASEILESAADRSIAFSAKVRADESDPPVLRVSLIPPGAEDDPPASVPLDPPSDPDIIRQAILRAAYKLIASELSTSGDLRTLSTPREKETPAESLSHRITRRAWATYAAENP